MHIGSPEKKLLLQSDLNSTNLSGLITSDNLLCTLI